MNENKNIGNVLPPQGNLGPQNNNLVGQSLGATTVSANVQPVNNEVNAQTSVEPSSALGDKTEFVNPTVGVNPPVSDSRLDVVNPAFSVEVPPAPSGNIAQDVVPTPLVEPVAPVSSIPVVEPLPTAPIEESFQATPVVASIPKTPVKDGGLNSQKETIKIDQESSISPTVATPPVTEVISMPTQSPSTSSMSAGIDPVSPSGNSYKATPVVPLAPDKGLIDKENIMMPNQETVGIIPPEKKEKKKMNRILFFFLILLLIGLIAFGLYYFLSNSAMFSSPNTKDLVIEIYDDLPASVSELVDLNGTSESSCTLDLSNVKTSLVGSYVYSVTCDDFYGEGTITVIDASVLEASGTTVDLIKDTTDYSADMFVSECSKQNCYYEFGDANLVDEYVSSTGASNLVEIIVTDDSGTSVIVESYLNVAIAYLDCTSEIIESSVYDATYTITDRILIGTGNIYIGVAYRYTTYTFSSEEDYDSFVGINDDSSDIEVYSTDVSTLTVVLKESLSDDVLTSEYGSEFPEDYSSIKSYYTANDYTVVVSTN